MRIVALIPVFLTLHACMERKVPAVAPVVREKQPEASTTNRQPVEIWSSDDVQIYGDTTGGKWDITFVRKRFEPYITFEDFSVRREFDQPKANLILDKDAKRFRTVITNAFREDAEHFAGHYVFVQWGCGSPCQDAVIIDRNTGKVYDVPSASLGYNFQDNSRMLITNPPDTTGFYSETAFSTPTIYVLNEATKIFDERKPR